MIPCSRDSGEIPWTCSKSFFSLRNIKIYTINCTEQVKTSKKRAMEKSDIKNHRSKLPLEIVFQKCIEFQTFQLHDSDQCGSDFVASLTSMKKPMILCARSTSRSREQITKRRSSSDNMWKVCLVCSQNNKIVWLSNMADTFYEVRKGLWAFFLDCAFRMLIGWTDKAPVTWIWSHYNCAHIP